MNTVQDYADIAAATQRIYEEILDALLSITADKTFTTNIVLVGSCILDCVANERASKYFDKVWIPPHPGDAGSAIGCVLAHRRQFCLINNYIFN